MDLEKHIRCKCGKFWGMRNHKRTCKRCKTEVIARGGKLIKENKMAKKPTMMETKERIDMITRNVNFTSRMLESIGVAFSNYVKFKGDEDDFKNYLEKSKNLHKLSEEENEARKSGHNKQDNDLPAKEVRKESDGKE